jgi:RHS repeat-associated protein
MPATCLCTYHYDPLDRLTGHAVAAHVPVQRFYCKSRLATEIEGAINRSIVQHDEQLLALTETLGNIRQATLVTTDRQRSVLQAIASNESQSFAYSPYGHRPTSGGLLSLLGFNGERPDPVTGHYLLGNGYRAFNPVLMRFNSPDNLSPFDEGGLNPYAYCSGDPINMIDPNGTAGVFNMIISFYRRARNNTIPGAVYHQRSGLESTFSSTRATYRYFNFDVLKSRRTSITSTSNVQFFDTSQKRYPIDSAGTAILANPEITTNRMAILSSKNPTPKESAYSRLTNFTQVSSPKTKETSRYSHINLHNKIERRLDTNEHARFPDRPRYVFNNVLRDAKSGYLPGVNPAEISYLQYASDDSELRRIRTLIIRGS